MSRRWIKGQIQYLGSETWVMRCIERGCLAAESGHGPFRPILQEKGWHFFTSWRPYGWRCPKHAQRKELCFAAIRNVDVEQEGQA